jgi:hypothetical protein
MRVDAHALNAHRQAHRESLIIYGIGYNPVKQEAFDATRNSRIFGISGSLTLGTEINDNLLSTSSKLKDDRDNGPCNGPFPTADLRLRCVVFCQASSLQLESTTQRSALSVRAPTRTIPIVQVFKISFAIRTSSCALANGERQFHFVETVCLLTGGFSFSAHAQTHVQQFDELEHELEWTLESLGVLLAPRERTDFATEL